MSIRNFLLSLLHRPHKGLGDNQYQPTQPTSPPSPTLFDGKQKNGYAMPLFVALIVGILAGVIWYNLPSPTERLLAANHEQQEEVAYDLAVKLGALTEVQAEVATLSKEVTHLTELKKKLKEEENTIIDGKPSLLPVANAESPNVSQNVESQPTTDIDKLAHAVAMAETKNCELGYGAMYNNCFGIKRGSIVPCETGQNNMCIFANKQDSFSAFKKIWTEGYGGGYPTVAMAATWTGNDRPDNWLKNVAFHYNN